MNLKNEEAWNDYVSKNTDPYGKACVDVARRVMEILDSEPAKVKKGYFPDLQTAHGMICRADEETKAGGITDYMAGAAAHMVVTCHQRGEEFRIAWNGEEESDGTVNPAILTINT